MNNKTIIITNNHQSSKQLESWIKAQMPQLELIGKADNTEAGLTMFQQKQVELVFINLSDLTADGFLQLQQIQRRLSRISLNPNHLKLKINGETKSIPYENIIRLEACSNYTQIYLSGLEQPILTSRTLKFYMNKLDENRFVRPHQSHLVNKQFIEQVVFKPKSYLLLNGGLKISIARRRLTAFKKMEI